ncbi:MAG: hypothetical protein A2041_13295 [Bacteroidetes bacterium GWA2_31_9b]|nr:MAG: hypothetical protein A2041_13295 [Bacteroidetes bacterium GWA2_31_9b]
MTSTEIKQVANDLGADLCGIASIDSFSDSPKGFHPADVFKDTKSIISIACRVPESSFLANTKIPYTAVENLALARVSQIALSIVLYLEKQGAKTVLVPSEPYDYWDAEKMEGKGILSLKHLGYKAGLGYMGRNSLLCNESYGNLIKLGAVITDAVLVPDKISEGNMCPDICNLCELSCPVGAIENQKVNQKKCRQYSEIVNKRGAEIYTCYECRKVCPNRNGIK